MKNLKVEEAVFKVSDNVVFSTSSSSLSPCAIRAVETIVSWSDSWSNHETLSVTSGSPRSSKDALEARFVLAGLTLNNPFDVVTACLKIWYWAAEIFLLSPSSSSSSEMDLLASGSKAGVKLTGDPSRVEDSTDEDLETGERDLDSLDSLQLLARLTGVLTCLTGVLVNLCGVLGLLSGVLAGVADLLSVESCLGAGNDDWTAGVSGTLAWYIWRCNNVHIDIKSTSVAWLMDLGIEGKSGLLVPVNMETSGPPPAVVAAGVPCPADPSTGWRAGPSDSTGSSNCRAQLWDDSTTETSAGSSTVAGPSPVAGPLPVAGPSPVVEPSPVAGPSPAAPSITGAGTWTSGADSRWTFRAGEEITVIVLFSGGLTILGDNCTSCLATYECPVLSALSCLLSWWLGGDLRSGNARDEAGDRDLWSPDDWWWRWWEEEAEGQGVRRLGNTAGLGTSPGAGPARGTWTGPLVLSPSTVTPRRMVSGGVLSFVGPVSSLPVRTSRPTGSPTRGSWAVPPQKPQTSVHRTQNSWLWSWSVLPWMTRCCWPVWKGVVASLQEHGFRRNLAFFPAAAALCRVFWALAFAWAAQASGSQSVQTRQGLSWVQSGCPSFKRHCWQRKWLSFLLRKWEYPGNLGWDSAEDDRSCDRSTILSMQVRLDKEVNMASHANLLAQRSTWDQLISLHGQPKLSSFFVFDKRLGRPLGQCVNWTHVRSRARRKSKWTIGGCGALRKCGCAWTDKGTQFLCVKFRLGSAGKPTICSHCYDVLNEEGNYTVSHQHTKPFPKS